MHRFRFGLMSLVGLLAASTALAGEVKGKVSGSPGNKGDKAEETESIVVWIEGVDGAAAPKEPVKISQKGAQFSPRFSVAVVGQDVEMPNNDNIAHNVYSKSAPKSFNLGVYPKGESKTVVFDKPGRVDLMCSLHRQMNAIIFVVPSPHFAVLPKDGEFTISGLKPGKYTLKAWQKGCEDVSQEVTVPESGAASADVALKASAKSK